MCVDTTLVSGHSPFRSGHSPPLHQTGFGPLFPIWVIPKPVLALLPSYWVPYERCPPIGRPFGALWALPSYWAALWRHLGAALLLGAPFAPFLRRPITGLGLKRLLAHAQMPLRRSAQSLLRNPRTFILWSLCWAFIEVTPPQRNHTGHSQPCSFSYANHI